MNISVASGGSAGLDHLQADETHDLTNSVQEVAEAAHKDVAEARSDTKVGSLGCISPIVSPVSESTSSGTWRDACPDWRNAGE